MHRLDHITALRPTADVGLICDHNQKEIRGFQSGTSVGYIVVEFEILNAGRGIRLSVSDYNPVEDSVAIEKNRAERYTMLSHFVSATLSVG